MSITYYFALNDLIFDRIISPDLSLVVKVLNWDQLIHIDGLLQFECHYSDSFVSQSHPIKILEVLEPIYILAIT